MTSFRDAYLATASRVSDFALARESQLATVIPYCPDWTARDVIGHLAGITDDWVTGRLDGYATPGWTEAQVNRHRSDDLATLLAGWSEARARLDRIEPHTAMGEPWRWLFGDALTHEADLYETVDPANRPPGDAVVAGIGSLIPRWRQVMADADAPPLVVDVPGVRSWRVGREVDGGVDAPITLTVGAYDLWRFLAGRSTRRAVEEYDWTGECAAILDRGLPFPFEFRQEG